MQLTTLTTNAPDNGLVTTLHHSRADALTALRAAYNIGPAEHDALAAARRRGIDVRVETQEIPAALNIDHVDVTTYHGETDQVPVVQVDAPDGYRVRINLNDAPVYDGDPGTDAGAGLVSREQADTWTGRELTDDEWNALSIALPHSTIPDAVGTIADHLTTGT